MTVLQKVEELTLYAIEQKERANSLGQENRQLQARLEAEYRHNDRQAARIEQLEEQLQQLLQRSREER